MGNTFQSSEIEKPLLQNANSPLLSVKNLSTRLQVESEIWTIVDDLNFQLYTGKTLAIVGESGSGKTMSALSILRILPPSALASSGEVIYKGENLLNISEKKMRGIRGSKISMIFQDPMSALNPVYTIGWQLAEVAELHLNVFGEEALQLAATALENVGISDPLKCLNDYPHQLSGGMKQRVMIAMALMCKPDILIADEPTTALDVTIQAQVLQLIQRLQKENGMAVLLITHDLGVVAEMADQVMVMYMAQSIESGSVFDIFDNPAHPYTQGLFKSRPTIQGKLHNLKPIPGNIPSFGHIPSGCRFHPRCPYAMEKCKKGPIPYYKIDNHSLHDAKCVLYDKSEESAQKLAQLRALS